MPRKKTPIVAPPPRPGYSFADVLALTSATKSNLLHWSNIGVITAGIEDSAGSGFPRRYSPLNVIEVQLCAAINAFKVPAETIRGVANVFRDFHWRAVALHEEVEGAPLLVMPPHLALFKSVKVRQSIAHTFIQSKFPPHATDADMSAAADQAKALAREWAWLRTGPLVRGIPEPNLTNFLGLFVGDGYAVVALNPTDLRAVVQDACIVVDLADVIFRVGERCRKLGVSLGEW